MTSFTSIGQHFYLGLLFWYLWTTHPPRALVYTCAQVCTKLTHVPSRKVLSLTKPKGKIYETKSLGHYIIYLSIYHVKVWTRYAGHSRRSSHVLLRIPAYRRASVHRPAKTCIHNLCTVIGRVPGVIDDRNGWQERVKELPTISTTWWWGSINIQLSISSMSYSDE